MRKVLSISLDTVADADILAYLDDVPVKSLAIKEALREFIHRKKQIFNQEQIEQIKLIVSNMMNENGINTSDTKMLADAINDCLNDF